MKYYNVTIKGVQKHISGYFYESKDHGQVEDIIFQEFDYESGEPQPKFNGEWHYLNDDHNIMIEEV